MKRLLIALLLVSALSGCGNKVPEVVLKPVTVEDIVAKPDPALFKKAPPKIKLVPGEDNGKAIKTITSNNLRSNLLEDRLEDLQSYVCAMFKKPVGEVCPPSK